MTLDGPEVAWRPRTGAIGTDGAVVGGPRPSGLHGVAEKLSCSPSWPGWPRDPPFVGQQGGFMPARDPLNSFFKKMLKYAHLQSERVPALSPCIHLTVRWPQPMVAFLWELSLQLLWGN